MKRRDREAPPNASRSANPPRRWLRPLGVGLLIPVVTIGLTAWILPAAAKQWQDRQRAQELKVELISDIAKANATLESARLIPENLANAGDQQAAARQRSNAVLLTWYTKSASIDARLHVYFSTRIHNQWAGTSAAAVTTISMVSWSSETKREELDLLKENLSVMPGEFVGSFWHDLVSAPIYLSANADDSYQYLLDEIELRTFQVSDAVLHAEPATFSTSFGDFLRDLVP